MAQPGDEYVLAWIRDKQDAKKEAESRGMDYKPDFEIQFLLRLLDEAQEIIDSVEARYDV